MLRIDGHDDAILGPALAWSPEGRVFVLVYDAEVIRSTLMSRDGMSAEEAREFIEFNIEGAYMGPDTPVLLWKDDCWNDE